MVEHEPSTALFTKDIIQTYSSIIELAEHKLTEQGTLFLELHDKHADELIQLFAPSDWDAGLKEDYAQKKRFIKAQKQS